MKLVECVPNFSEGRDEKVIKAITDEIEKVDGVKLLDVDPGKATNRTVVTFIGTPDGVVEAAFQAIKKASEVIDMRNHQGEHARMGATDVCPLVPVSDITVDECIELAKTLGKKVAEELSIPVFLYEHAATSKDRQNLATIRKGEYEGLEEKLKNPKWKPDFGEAVFNPKSGATVIGVREFLIAYNINLNTKNTKIAKRIGNKIREKGTFKRDENGKLVKDEEGNKIMEPGFFKFCKATGWYIEEYGFAQVTMNLTNYHVTPPHLVLEKVRELVFEEGVVILGSELVGLIPKEALIKAGKYYMKMQNGSTGIPDDDLIDLAINSMGLQQLGPFDKQAKIIENHVLQDKLNKLTIRAFADETSRDSPAPGGGSVAALAGALAASLAAMVANLTYGKKKFKHLNAIMDDVSLNCQKLKDEFLFAIDADTDAFNKIMEAFSLPKKSDEDIEIRNKTIEDATKGATLIPFHVLQKIPQLLDAVTKVVMDGNPNSLSDAGVAGLMSQAAALGTYFNVVINCAGISDKAFVNETLTQAEKTREEVITRCTEIEKMVRKRLLADIEQE